MHDTTTQVPHPKCSLSSICPFPPHSKARIPQFLIIPRHQPFISAFTSTWPSCWRSGEFQQPAKFSPKQTSTPICLCIFDSIYHIRHYSSTHYTPSKTKTFSPLSSTPLSVSFFRKLPPYHFIFPPTLSAVVPSTSPHQCSSTAHHHSRHLIPIFHITHTQRETSPCIPCSSNGEIPAAKIMTTNKTKSNLKNMLCSH